jgi:hypothetical protein
VAIVAVYLDVKAKSTSSRIASAGELGPASLARLKQRLIGVGRGWWWFHPVG